jgi:hypothetical protein
MHIQYLSEFWKSASSGGVMLLLTAAGFLAAVLVPSIIYRKSMRRKVLTYEVITDAQLLRIDDAIVDRVQVLLDGHPARNIGLALVSIQNTGKDPIERSDYEQSIRLEFGKSAEVISVDAIEMTPSNLFKSSIGRSDNGSFELSNVLLNPGDKITLQFIVKDHVGEIGISARIVGISGLTNRAGDPQASDPLKVYALNLSLMLCTVAAILFVRDNNANRVPISDRYFAVLLGAFFVILTMRLLTNSLQRWHSRRERQTIRRS